MLVTKPCYGLQCWSAGRVLRSDDPFLVTFLEIYNSLLIEFHSKVEGIGNPDELKERFEVSDPPVEQPQRAGILGLKKDLNITRK